MELRTLSDGRVCCSQIDRQGRRVAPDADHMCDACKAHFAAQANAGVSSDWRIGAGNHTQTYAAPDPYAGPLAARRAAAENHTSAFERRFQAERAAALRGGRA